VYDETKADRIAAAAERKRLNFVANARARRAEEARRPGNKSAQHASKLYGAKPNGKP
jgi:hypothetical protein